MIRSGYSRAYEAEKNAAERRREIKDHPKEVRLTKRMGNEVHLLYFHFLSPIFEDGNDFEFCESGIS